MTFKSEKNKNIFIILLIIILLIAACYSSILGTYNITISKVFNTILFNITGYHITDFTKTDEIIIWNIRIPRIIMAILVGASLGTSGSIYQGIFRNPIVEPFILGVSAGAAFGAALGIVIPHIFFNIQLSAFIFALIAVLLSYILAKNKEETNTVNLVLSGIIIGSIFTAMVSILKYISEDTQLREITFWMMGGLYYSSWYDVMVNFISFSISFTIVWILSWKLNILSMGDEEAKSLGINPEIYKTIFIITATLITGISVSSVGIIPWIGLMMPHVSRLIVGPDNRYLIPTSALLGAIYMIICDTLARTITQAEIPVGIITSILGGPFLLWLLRSRGYNILK